MEPRHLAISTAIAAACAAVPALAGDSTAQYAQCASTEGIGLFSATVTYSYSGGSSASVSILLMNDTPSELGGFITGLALNGGVGVTGLAFQSSTIGTFEGLVGPVSAPPFGSFLAGASTGQSWLGGGNPSKGIGDGGSATFVFGVSGSAAALAALSAEDIFGSGELQMAVRFRGGSPDDWSDKALGCALPAPGALALLGVCGLVSPRRRR